ncbi:MAG: dimethylamine corrinoid protein 3 [delta proteobacterium ML8_D]|nr:MAG: dimethylamine corrinoid protein 3 [Firmicutes bacterium ML8_F2]OPL12299.1 MAG: dimethylamine corrinoid protein 3 [delta proteobacterium ML8_D]
MSLKTILNEAKQSILDIDQEKAVAVAEQALDEGLDPVKVLTDGYSVGIREIGDLFSRGEVFLPEMILASEAMKAAVEILNSALEDKASKTVGKMVFATVEGDVHDIGKGIALALIQTQGVEVIDLGRDVPVEKIIEEAEKNGANVIGTSALLTTTMPNQEKLEAELRKRGMREKYKTIIGGAPCTQRWADKIGADAYAEDAAEGVNKVLELLKS